MNNDKKEKNIRLDEIFFLDKILNELSLDKLLSLTNPNRNKINQQINIDNLFKKLNKLKTSVVKVMKIPAIRTIHKNNSLEQIFISLFIIMTSLNILKLFI
tara:strand:- start:2228 stop:2530 length:303 start_codon:yes stop_codon:yes gene_type:complete